MISIRLPFIRSVSSLAMTGVATLSLLGCSPEPAHESSAPSGREPPAATGLLAGRDVTTFPSDRDALRDMFPTLTVHYDANFVVDGKYITSVGGALSYEPALYLLETEYSVENAVETAAGLVLDWDLASIPHYVAGR